MNLASRHAPAAFLSFLMSAVPCVLLASCRSDPPAAGIATAECPVCKHEGDLACVCVHVEADTPSCECAGKTYYFCSDECRADFQAHPERYVKQH